MLAAHEGCEPGCNVEPAAYTARVNHSVRANRLIDSPQYLRAQLTCDEHPRHEPKCRVAYDNGVRLRDPLEPKCHVHCVAENLALTLFGTSRLTNDNRARVDSEAYSKLDPVALVEPFV